jgi:hypothetical protein
VQATPGGVFHFTALLCALAISNRFNGYRDSETRKSVLEETQSHAFNRVPFDFNAIFARVRRDLAEACCFAFNEREPYLSHLECIGRMKAFSRKISAPQSAELRKERPFRSTRNQAACGSTRRRAYPP